MIPMKPLERLIIGIFCCCILPVIGCQNATIEHARSTAEPLANAKNIVSLAALIPNDLWAGKILEWKPLLPEELSKLLSIPMPRVTAANENQTLEQAVRQISNRELLWLPPRLNATAKTNWTYKDDMETWTRKGKIPTLGEVLLAQLTADHEAGDAYVRTYRPNSRPIDDAQNTSAPTGGPNLLDMIIVTERYIAIVAVPAK